MQMVALLLLASNFCSLYFGDLRNCAQRRMPWLLKNSVWVLSFQLYGKFDHTNIEQFNVVSIYDIVQ